jgi:hypothetical protein
MPKQWKMDLVTAKTMARNALRFNMNRIVYHMLRAACLLKIKPV